MEKYLMNIIERICTKDTLVSGYNSDNSVSWNAYRDAEKLTDLKYIPQLMDYISVEKNKEFRSAAYFILGKLLAKIADSAAVQFYINRLSLETDKYVVSRMLGVGGLQEIEKDKSIDISPIIKCVASEKWLIRHAAIQALAKTNHESAKEIIRNIIKLEDQKKNKYEISYAVSVLATIGKTEDVALLKPLLTSRIRDIKEGAKFAIYILENDGEIPEEMVDYYVSSKH